MDDLQLYVYELMEEVKEDFIEWNIPFNDDFILVINSRLKRALGRCNYATERIEISKAYAETFNDGALKNTIAHELLHTTFRYDGHNGNWKRYAQIVNKVSNGKYLIKRTTKLENDLSSEELKIFNSKVTSNCKYEVYCPKCGSTWKYKTMCKTIKHPSMYKCGKCGIELKLRIL